MGFCRRCGDICAVRCNKCGGTAVAPAVQFGQKEAADADSWSKTYASSPRDKSPTRRPVSTYNVPSHSTGSTSSADRTSPTKRFPRPVPEHRTGSSDLNSRVSAHIANTTSQLNRPPSPLKHSTVAAPEADILPSPHTSSLAKVYGSVLQPKETLETHSCAICSTAFSPDATIYPDLSSDPSEHRFLCRPCFTTNGGSKGDCPSCGKPVLVLKNEGGFIQASGSFWHKKCFTCVGCHKNIGHQPMVDLMGRPSCPDCFEACLKRDPTTPKRKTVDLDMSSPKGKIGGMSTYEPGKSRESSPALEELEQRLGIRSREASPALEDLDRRLRRFSNMDPERSPFSERKKAQSFREESPTPAGRDYNRVSMSPEIKRQLTGASISSKRKSIVSASTSPIRPNPTGSSSPAPTEEAIEEMKRRFLKSVTNSPAASTIDLDYSPPPRRLRSSRSSSSLKDTNSNVTETPSKKRDNSPPARTRYRSPSPSSTASASVSEVNIPPTPDLVSDFSDSATQSSFTPDSPPRTRAETNMYGNPKIYGRGNNSRYAYTRDRTMDSDTQEESLFLKSRYRTLSSPSVTPTKDFKSSAINTKSPPQDTWSPPITPLRLMPTGESPSPSATCATCGGGLFSLGEGGKFVTVPSDSGSSKTYHVACFRCVICEGTFREAGKGQAVFVRGQGGPCHVECTIPERTTVRARTQPAPAPSIYSTKSSSSTSAATKPTSSASKPKFPTSQSGRQDRPLVPSQSTAFPRWGSSMTCPGCRKSVSPMERGVVPGPQGSRWHATCLVCGGKRPPMKFPFKEERKPDEPGCGKKLDSAAKTDSEGGVWCRECLLLLPDAEARSDSPTRPLVPSHTGGNSTGPIRPQHTGGTTIAQQFTGLGLSSDAALIRQLTGGGLSPTRTLDRSTSPTKQLGNARPRPKSVLGLRSGKSVDERMFLARQGTGSSSSSHWKY